MTGAGQLGRFGIWRSASLVTPQLAADIERLGFGTLWLGSSPAGDLVQAEELLDATTTLMLATSIVNMWQDQPEDVAALVRPRAAAPSRPVPARGRRGSPRGDPAVRQAVRDARPLRGCAPGRGGPPRQPGAGRPGHEGARPGQGPRRRRDPLSRPARAPRGARAVLGSGPLLAPEHKVVLDTDPDRARALGRTRCSPIWAWSTTPATCAGWAGARKSSAGTAATS